MENIKAVERPQFLFADQDDPYNELHCDSPNCNVQCTDDDLSGANCTPRCTLSDGYTDVPYYTTESECRKHGVCANPKNSRAPRGTQLLRTCKAGPKANVWGEHGRFICTQGNMANQCVDDRDKLGYTQDSCSACCYTDAFMDCTVPCDEMQTAISDHYECHPNEPYVCTSGPILWHANQYPCSSNANQWGRRSCHSCCRRDVVVDPQAEKLV